MGRILPFYRTGGVVSGGGGGGPLGDATVWPQIADWSAFGTIAGPLRTGDRVFVSDLAAGSGYAQYNGADWELVQGFFATVADLLAFGAGGELIYTTGEALVGAGDETSVVYYYTGAAWDRMPDGSLFISNVPDWASLPTADTVLNNDEVTVDDLGYTGSSGVAQWHAATPEWRLIEGQFTSVADMLAFDGANAVHNLAIARVKAASPFNDRSIVYIHHSGVWTRSGVTTTEGYAWTITSLSQADPSGIGATQIGDYGRFTDPLTGAINVYRLASIAIAPGIGGGTVTRWIPEDVYGRANLQVVAYCVGDEVMPGYGSSLRGYTYDRTGAATIGTVSGYMRLDAPTPGSGSQFAFMTGPNIIGSKRFYIVSDARGVTVSTNGQAGFFNLSSVPESQWTLAQQGNQGTTLRPVGWNGSIWAPATTSVRNGTGNTLSASDPWIIEGWSAGTAITDMMVTRVNGQVYTSLVRNFDAATLSTNFNVFPLAGGSATGPSTGRFEIRNHYVMTYD